MQKSELEKLLLIEVQREIASAARHGVSKLGKKVPVDALSTYLSPDERQALAEVSTNDFNHPLVVKAMLIEMSRSAVLAYPPDGTITEEDAVALESLNLSDAQRSVVERVVAEACHNAFFRFFCLLDAVGDPTLTRVPNWRGARLTYGRQEGSMLHDELGTAYYEYLKRGGSSDSQSHGD